MNKLFVVIGAVLLISMAFVFAGCSGDEGATGAKGTQGSVGPAGSAGPAGAAGAKGATGPTGLAGPTGATGQAGAAGATGARGPAGSSGATGAAGPAGTAGAKGSTGSTGPAGPQGPAGEAPSEPAATAASISTGGLIYDKWWKGAAGATEPEGDQALWATQDTNTRSGADSWRCKECHGWDYKGKGGAYSSGSHFTGFTGVYNASLTKTKAQLTDAMMGGTDYRHDFSTVLSAEAIEDLVNFLKEGPINDVMYIDYATKKAIGADTANGKTLYTSTCAICHGANGKLIDFHNGEGVKGVANDNPTETLHKIRFGQPATGMPSSVVNGWSTQDAVDVLGYSQELPD